MEPLVLLRCHAYNAHVRTAFDALSSFSSRCDPILLLDVTNGDIVSDVPTLKFDGERLRKIGLELYPKGQWAWFAGDYALYCAFLERPEFSHYVMIDYDARINFQIDEFLGKVAKGGWDFVASYAGFERSDWMWSAAGKYWFDRVAGCFFPIVVMSRKLLLKCLEHRLAHARTIPVETPAREEFLRERWMNCEAFVPSVALAEGCPMADIQQFVPGWNYSFVHDVDALYWEMPELASVPFAHPVFLREDLPLQISKRLGGLPPGDLREWVVKRAIALRGSDGALWEAILAANPELRDAGGVRSAAFG
jgi:hypothetical protein